MKTDKNMPPHIREAFKTFERNVAIGRTYNTDLITESRSQPPMNRYVPIQEAVAKFGVKNFMQLQAGPWILSELAWDFAESCCDISANLRISELRRLCRTVKDIRLEHDRIRQTIFTTEAQRRAYENCVEFQECYSALFSKITLAIRLEVRKIKPSIALDEELLIASAYMCAVVIRAMARYCDVLEGRLTRCLGVKRMGTTMPDTMFQLSAVILEFAGDARITAKCRDNFPDFLIPHSEELVNRFLESGPSDQTVKEEAEVFYGMKE